MHHVHGLHSHACAPRAARAWRARSLGSSSSSSRIESTRHDGGVHIPITSHACAPPPPAYQAAAVRKRPHVGGVRVCGGWSPPRARTRTRVCVCVCVCVCVWVCGGVWVVGCVACARVCRPRSRQHGRTAAAAGADVCVRAPRKSQACLRACVCACVCVLCACVCACVPPPALAAACCGRLRLRRVPVATFNVAACAWRSPRRCA
jgi:hypothetical protein